MTSSLAELQRKVRQNDNDIQAIYGMLHDIAVTQKRHGNRLDEFEERFDRVDNKLDAQDVKLQQILDLLNNRS